MINIFTYLDKWRSKLNTAKTTTTAFHRNNREANRQLKIFVRELLQPYQSHPTYLEVKLDRKLTCRQHLKGLRSKVSARNNLIRCLAGTSWGAKTSTLRISALAVAYSATEYAAPAWCRSKHTRKMDVALNDTIRIITGCLQPTPTECIPVLAGIPPPSLCREALTSKFVNKVVASEHYPLRSRILSTTGSFLPRQRLLSRRPFPPSCIAITWYITVQHHGILDEQLELCAFPPCRIWFVTCKQTLPRVRSPPQAVVYPESPSHRSWMFQLLFI